MAVKAVIKLKSGDVIELAGTPQLDFLSDFTEAKGEAAGFTQSGNSGRANKFYGYLENLLNGTTETVPVYDGEDKVVGVSTNLVTGSIQGWSLPKGSNSLDNAKYARVPASEISYVTLEDI